MLYKIQEHLDILTSNGCHVTIHLNEFEPNNRNQSKFKLLKQSCQTFIEEKTQLKQKITIEYYNEDFEILFPKLLPLIDQVPALVFLDQNGIKFLSAKYFLELEKTRQTDFLYFVSSSYIWRFGERREFKLHLDIDMAQIRKKQYHKIHRSITEQIRNKLPADSRLKLYPFSLKKGANIHGIIFGATHPRAVDKFLSIAWKTNEVNGDANFDIDDEASKCQLNMFETPKPSKIAAFQMELEKQILSGSITNNLEALNFTFENGHIPKHARDCVTRLKKFGKIDYNDKTPCISYNLVYKEQKLVPYSLLKR
nr:three-Cys-motif partner protein TcmP [Roseivirga pacifica]